MKKLMIAAATAAMVGGAFAAEGFVYDLSFKLKTLTVKSINASCAICDDGCSYFEQGNRTLAGLVAVCDPCDPDAPSNTDWGILIWEKAINASYSPLVSASIVKAEELAAASQIQADDFKVFSKKGTKAWLAFSFGGQAAKTEFIAAENVDLPLDGLSAVGVGSYAAPKFNKDGSVKRNGYIKSISGNVTVDKIGTLNAKGVWATGNYLEEYCEAFDWCDDSSVKDANEAAAYGTWTMKLASNKAKKPLYNWIPAYCFE